MLLASAPQRDVLQEEGTCVRGQGGGQGVWGRYKWYRAGRKVVWCQSSAHTMPIPVCTVRQLLHPSTSLPPSPLCALLHLTTSLLLNVIVSIPHPTCSSEQLSPTTAVSPMTTPVPWSMSRPFPAAHTQSSTQARVMRPRGLHHGIHTAMPEKHTQCSTQARVMGA